jgi:hypothetical protein
LEILLVDADINYVIIFLSASDMSYEATRTVRIFQGKSNKEAIENEKFENGKEIIDK